MESCISTTSEFIPSHLHREWGTDIQFYNTLNISISVRSSTQKNVSFSSFPNPWTTGHEHASSLYALCTSWLIAQLMLSVLIRAFDILKRIFPVWGPLLVLYMVKKISWRERESSYSLCTMGVGFQRLFSLALGLLSSPNKSGYVQPKRLLFLKVFWS